jgi:hypothetical protein
MNIIVVESKNDKAFINALVSHLNIANTEVDPPIALNEEDFIITNGTDPNPIKPSLLTRKLKDVKADVRKKDIQNIGIVLDIDNNSFEDRFLMVNTAIKDAFNGEFTNFSEITDISRFFQMNYGSDILNFACYFTNVSESGDLETLLKNIKSQDSDYADCLESWKTCIEQNGKTITSKEFDKFWVSNYLRFDTCIDREKNQANRFCSMASFDYIMENKSNIFNLDSDLLADLKAFLRLFN